jgi:predicted Abi (CAAX) family protease
LSISTNRLTLMVAIIAERSSRRRDGMMEGMTRTVTAALGGRVRDLAVGLGTLPGRREWLESAVWALLLVVLSAPLAWAGGLIELPPAASAGIARTVLLPFLVPALLEECFFRGLLLPHPARSGLPLEQRARWWAVSLIAYVAVHPIAAAFVRPAAQGVFDTPAFLVEALLLGITATALYERTGSLWPAVLLHGAVVAVWLNLGGLALLAG